MVRSSRRTWRYHLPTCLGVLVVVALVGFFIVFVAYSDELKHPDVRHLLITEQSSVVPVPAAVATGAVQTLITGQPSLGQATADQATRTKVEDKPVEVAQPAAAAAGRAGTRTESAAAAVDAIRSRAAAAAAASETARAAGNSSNQIIWKMRRGKSCQNYADEDSTARTLKDSKAACLRNDACVAIECPSGREFACTLRAIANFVDYPPSDCYEQIEKRPDGSIVTVRVHPAYNSLLQEYPFQQVTTQTGNQVNIMLVRSQPNDHQQQLYRKYKDDILFLGISSMNDYPLPSSESKTDFTGMFPGFLHMMREPEKSFPPNVKTLLMSQSDFSHPDYPARDYSIPRKYDFTYSASDCDVEIDGHGWCGWSKNWTFVRQALEMMCGEFHLTGVLVATKNKAGTKAYTIPKSCEGRMIQTTYLAQQSDYFNYLKQSRFAFLPQIHDASPRVSTQALALDVPLLMNWYISGGWKYVNDETGEFFHDMSDFRQSLEKILRNADIPHRYEPRKWVLEHSGNSNSGKRLLEFVKEHFSHRIKLPKGTKRLLI